MFQIIIDPSKCKGCAECVTICDDDALKMINKTDEVMLDSRKSHRYFKNIGPSDKRYVSDNLLIDMMLKEETHIYTGGAGSCAGCGEGTALRMLCAGTGSKDGGQWGIRVIYSGGAGYCWRHAEGAELAALWASTRSEHRAQ